MKLVRAARVVTLTSYFALLALQPVWHAWLAPPVRFPVALALLITTLPLLFPLRGLLHARRYTHAWTPYLVLAYFTHGVVEAWANAAQRPFALAEIVFSVLLFAGALVWLRASATTPALSV
jgi:uncharacterized membrane protein